MMGTPNHPFYFRIFHWKPSSYWGSLCNPPFANQASQIEISAKLHGRSGMIQSLNIWMTLVSTSPFKKITPCLTRQFFRKLDVLDSLLVPYVPYRVIKHCWRIWKILRCFSMQPPGHSLCTICSSKLSRSSSPEPKISWASNTAWWRSGAGCVKSGMFVDFILSFGQMAMDQYLLIPFLVGWTSIYQLVWCSPGVQGFDTLPNHVKSLSWMLESS